MSDAYDRLLALTTERREAVLGELTEISEMELEHAYDEFLDDVYGTVNIAGLEYNTSHALALVDPVAYRCGFNDWIDSCEEQYIEYNGTYYSTDSLVEALEADGE